MAEIENSKDLISVLWSGADILRSKMDANEYKTYLLGLVFYKYLSDDYLATAYDLLNDKVPADLDEAQAAYEEAFHSDEKKELLNELKNSLHYTLDPDMTYVTMLNAAKENRFSREKLQAAFNRIHELSGLRQSTIDNILRGKSKNPKVRTLHKIATVFGMTLSEFLDFPELNDYSIDDEEDDD